MEFKDPGKRVAMMALKKAEAQKKSANTGGEEKKEENQEEIDDKTGENGQGDKADADERGKKRKAEDQAPDSDKDPMALLAEELEAAEVDVFALDDICDLGDG